MSHVDALARVSLFSNLSEEDLARISSFSREESYSEGANIVTIGEPGNTLFIVLEGTVRVLYPGRSQDLQLARLDAGDFFGEMALLNDEPRSATVQAMTPVRALLVDRDDFRDLVRNSGGVALNLLEALSYRIRNVGAQAGELHDQTLRDPLTGLLNRRAFQERLQEETNRAQRYGEDFSLLILDVDQFKVVNDTFGHDVGDEVLKWIGRILGEHTRAADAPFRIGGEEFAVLAPSAPPETAEALADRIRTVILESRPPLALEVNISVSIGYATCPDHARRSEALFRLADQAVIRGKAQGRNQVAGPDVITSSDRGPGPEDRRSVERSG
jgi:diguanylate cyclase (GGDEF)-like protein